MKYDKVIKGKFIERPNRFIAIVEISSGAVTCHVKNTGRCRELLISGCTVYLSVSSNPKRKTGYDLIAVEKETCGGTLLINIDSQIPNDIAEEWILVSGLFSKDMKYKREYTYGESRFDFCIEDGGKKIFLEVKGVTLEKEGIVMFPDAPTERGLKHVNELTEWVRGGNTAYLLFVVQLCGPKVFRLNDITDPKFSAAVRKAKEVGVNIVCVDCNVTPDEIVVRNFVNIQI